MKTTTGGKGGSEAWEVLTNQVQKKREKGEHEGRGERMGDPHDKARNLRERT